MRPIQFILIAILLLVTFVYFGRLRSHTSDRIVFVVIALGVAGLVAFPDLSGLMAQQVGVGRGVDLVIYLSLFGLSFLWLVLFSRQRDLDKKLTDLVRFVALAQAENDDWPPHRRELPRLDNGS